MYTQIPAADYIVWGITLAAECLCLWTLRHEQKFSSLRAVKLYLSIQIISALPMLVCAVWLSAKIYYLAFVVDSLLEYAAEIQIIVGIFRDIKGKSAAWGPIRGWVFVAIAFGTFLGLAGATHINGAPWEVVLWTLRNLSAFIRISILVSVVLFGFLMANAWVPSIAYTWLGLIIYVASDFFCNQLTVYEPEWEAILRHGPDAIFLMSLLLWSAAIPKKVGVHRDPTLLSIAVHGRESLR
jgi:hypothetical protein